mmetsp:Transcript_30498/g.50527  ORF Transcript_30498/g.50527 Transcript_30498/m.50527 type:complete len:272 (+) Transcript_30498:306-1121(+)
MWLDKLGRGNSQPIRSLQSSIDSTSSSAVSASASPSSSSSSRSRLPACCSSSAICARRCCSRSFSSACSSAARSERIACSSSSVRVRDTGSPVFQDCLRSSKELPSSGVGRARGGSGGGSRDTTEGRLSSWVKPSGTASSEGAELIAASIPAREARASSSPDSSSIAAVLGSLPSAPPFASPICLRRSSVERPVFGCGTPPGKSRFSTNLDTSRLTNRTSREKAAIDMSTLRSSVGSRVFAVITRAHQRRLRHCWSKIKLELADSRRGLLT